MNLIHPSHLVILSGAHAESKDPQSSNDLLAVFRHSPREAGHVTSSCRMEAIPGRGSDGNLSNSNILVTGLFHRLPCPFDICLHSVPAMKMI